MNPLLPNTLATHLTELRQRVLKVLVVLAVVFACLFPFYKSLYAALSLPLLHFLPQNATPLIAIEVTSPFLVPLKLCGFLSLLLTMPYCFYQLWRFVAPGLYAKEKQIVFPMVLMSTLLFYAGIAFSFFVVAPLALQFFAHAAPEGVTVLTDIRHYLDFMVTMLFSFGCAFQVPLVTVMAVRLGWVSIAQLSAWRPYGIVLAFTLGMILTPPDVISQVLLALPLWGLFELGLIVAKWQTKSPELPSRNT